jgi:hypothetical protein
MGQITQEQRKRRIKELLAELDKYPPEQHEVMRIPWSGGDARYCKVISMAADEVLLNPDSHRLQSQLQDDPRWDEASKDKLSDAAQQVIAEHVRKARTKDKFDELVESIRTEGQQYPGVMTDEGILINANTRAVAIRELEDPQKRYIRVAVLPTTAQPEALAVLELRLQMQKELKEDYSFTNELLFVLEMHKKYHMSFAQIAKELRLPGRKGEAEVELRLKLLDLIRLMQNMPEQPLPLTFFDDVSLQQLRDLHAKWEALSDRDPAAAKRLLEAWIVSVASGVSNVHSLRKIDLKFVSDYMVPTLGEDEMIGPQVEKLVAPETPTTEPAGVGELLDQTADGDGADDADLTQLMNVLTSRDKRVEVPDSNVVLERDNVAEAVKTAIKIGIRDKGRDDRADNKLEAPITNVRQAIRLIDASVDALRSVHGDPEFDDKHRKSLAAAVKKLRRTVRQAEESCGKLSVKID